MKTTNSKKFNIAAGEYRKENGYWMEKLKGDLVRSSFYNDFFVNEQYDIELDTYLCSLNNELCGKLNKITKGIDSNLFMVLASGLTLLLDRYTNNKDIIIGFPIEKQEVDGKFLNKVLTLRNIIDDDISFKEFLLKVRESIIGAVENQNYPIEVLCSDLSLENKKNYFSLFDVAILLENIHERAYLNELPLNTIFSFKRNDNSVILRLEYNKKRYSKESIIRIVKSFETLLIEALNNFELKLLDLRIINDEENLQLEKFNDTFSKKCEYVSVIQMIEKKVKDNPNNIAAIYNDTSISYKDLYCKVESFAALLKAKGVTSDKIVAIMGVRNIEMVIAILGVLKAGGAYLPINANDPVERIKYILNDSQVQLILTQKHIVEKGTEMFADFPKENIILINTIDSNNVIEESISYKPNELAYVIYTSGTTGKPKGVMIENHNMVNYLNWASETYIKNEKFNMPFYSSFSFDMSITSIFLPLVTGNAILIYGGGDKEFILEKIITDNKSGIVKVTPSHLKMIRDNKSLISDIRKRGEVISIKKFIVGGEALETSLADDIYKLFDSNVEIYNEYGPTEATVGCMIYKYKNSYSNSHSVSIGQPIDNTKIYILDRNMNHSPVGVPGELFIAGEGLARGYLFKPEMTATRFITNPFEKDEKMYKTGDLARRLPDGNIDFIGRLDHQVKIRGFRVELGEIERKIVDFQRKFTRSFNQNNDLNKTWNLDETLICKKCLIPHNYPGVKFNNDGICSVCEEYDSYKDKADKYFNTPDGFKRVIEKARKTQKSKYDCLHLYSGGKDSSYVLHKLVEMGLNVLAFTYDNGYVSEKAFENIKRTTSLLNVDHIVVDSEYMNEVFVESLRTEHNVCNGCFKGVNTIGTKIAADYGINLVVSGLSRGQIFDIKLQGLFRLGIFDKDEIDERLRLFRKEYHSMKNKTSRLLKVELSEKEIDSIYFEDYFEYDNVSVQEIFDYLKEKDKGWCRPDDTGLSSSNCMINDVGIFIHLKDTGYHFYSAQLSWDVRLKTLSRKEGIEEITEFKVHPDTLKILTDIGYYKEPIGAVVVDKEDGNGDKYLCAYILENKDCSVSELKKYLSEQLPDYMIPAKFVEIDIIPLSSSGKVNRNALPEPEIKIETEYVAPRNDIERKLVEIWSQLLSVEENLIGIDVNFFQLGGHSLKATMLLTRINNELNVNISLVKLFESPTIRQIAEFLTVMTVNKNTEYKEVLL